VSLANDLLTTARQLAQLHQRRPRQADLRRAVSTAYYALFHGLAETAADRLVGATPPARSSSAWSRVYRDLTHHNAKKACVSAEQFSDSADLLLFTTTFPELQDLRHQADYDPNVRFQHNFVITRIAEASQALAALQRVPRAEQVDFATLALGMMRR
jgi:uncharacterized protein (UPF0332 family)